MDATRLNGNSHDCETTWTVIQSKFARLLFRGKDIYRACHIYYRWKQARASSENFGRLKESTSGLVRRDMHIHFTTIEKWEGHTCILFFEALRASERYLPFPPHPFASENTLAFADTKRAGHKIAYKLASVQIADTRRRRCFCFVSLLRSIT